MSSYKLTQAQKAKKAKKFKSDLDLVKSHSWSTSKQPELGFHIKLCIVIVHHTSKFLLLCPPVCSLTVSYFSLVIFPGPLVIQSHDYLEVLTPLVVINSYHMTAVVYKQSTSCSRYPNQKIYFGYEWLI